MSELWQATCLHKTYKYNVNKQFYLESRETMGAQLDSISIAENPHVHAIQDVRNLSIALSDPAVCSAMLNSDLDAL